MPRIDDHYQSGSCSEPRVPVEHRRIFDVVASVWNALAQSVEDIMAAAVWRAQTPTYWYPLTESEGGVLKVDDTQIETSVNLGVYCGSDGVLEYQLLKNRGSVWCSLNVSKGEFIKGHFRRIGPNTTVYPLIGHGNFDDGRTSRRP